MALRDMVFHLEHFVPTSTNVFRVSEMNEFAIWNLIWWDIELLGEWLPIVARIEEVWKAKLNNLELLLIVIY